jgi:K+-transporting ATPase KdpF subunit
MSAELFYGIGAVVSVLLLGYLVYALFRAEEF